MRSDIARFTGRTGSCDSLCGLLSQTAAKHTACDGAAIDVDRRCLIVFPGFGVLSRIHCTKCRTAINVVYGQRLFCVSLRTDIHFHITADYRRLTLTAAIDILTHGSVGHIHLGAAIHVGGITTAIDIANGRSLIVVVLLNRHLGITCCRSAGADGRLVAAAKDIACNRGITFDGQVGLTYLTEVMQIYISTNVIWRRVQFAAGLAVGQSYPHFAGHLPIALCHARRNFCRLKHAGVLVEVRSLCKHSIPDVNLGQLRRIAASKDVTQHRATVEYRSGLTLHLSITATAIEVLFNSTAFQVGFHIITRCQRERGELHVETSTRTTSGPYEELVVKVGGNTDTLLTIFGLNCISL